MPFLFGLLSTVSVILLLVLLTATTGFYLQSASIFFIIPVGGLFAGMGCGVGLFSRLIYTNKPSAWYYYLIAMLLGVIGFGGVYYTLYGITYVNSDLEINYRFQGEHISNFEEKESGKEMTFFNYMIQEVNNRQSTVKVGAKYKQVAVGHEFEPTNLGSDHNWRKFWLEGLGFIVGAMMVGRLIMSGYSLCERCQRYRHEIFLFNFKLTEFNQKAAALNATLASGEKLRQLAEMERKASRNLNEAHAKTSIMYCQNCFEGFLLIRVMGKNSKGGFKEVTKHRQTLPMHPDVVRQVVDRDKE